MDDTANPSPQVAKLQEAVQKGERENSVLLEALSCKEEELRRMADENAQVVASVKLQAEEVKQVLCTALLYTDRTHRLILAGAGPERG